MAAPTVLSESWATPSGSNATTYAVTVPTGSAGDVVECLVSSTSNANLSVSSGSGWKLVQQWKHASGLSEALFRKAVGTAGADSLTIASATSCRFNAHTVRLPAGTRTYASYSGATATGTNSNPPAVDHKKSRDTLYTAYRAGAGTVVPSAGPSGYGTRVNNAATSGGVSLTYAYKTATSSSDDPGTFTVSSALWGCVTIARWIDTTGPELAAFEALCRSPPSTPILVAGIGTSFLAGRKNAGAGADSQAGDSFATSIPAVWAANFTALPAKAFLYGTAGLVTPSNTTMAALDSRFSAGASFTATDSFAFYTMGRAGWGLTTSGQKATLSFGAAFNRVRVRFVSDPTLSVYTIDVDGGTPQNISDLTLSAGYREQTFTLTGTSSSVVNINSVGGPSTILAVEVWTDGVPQVSTFNAGWSSGNSNEMVANLAGLAAMAPHLTVLEPNLNDSVAGISVEQGQENARQLILTALASGEALYIWFPYAGPVGNEAVEDALAAPFEVVADALGAKYHNVHVETGFTSKTAQNALGYSDDLNTHPYVAGHAAWGDFVRLQFDPGPPVVTPANTAHGQTATSPTLGAISSVSPNSGTHAQSATEPSLSASGAATVTPDDAAHGHSAESPSVAAASAVSPIAGAHAQGATSPTVSAASTVSAGNAGHDHAATSPALTVASTVAPAEADHAHTAGSPALGTNTTAAPNDTAHAQSATSPTISAGGGTLWTPIDEPSSLEAWHDPSDAANLTLVSGKVSVDNDLSGNGHHDTQSFSSSVRPVLGSAVLNGLDVEEFAGGQTFQSTLVSDPTVRAITFLMKRTTGGTNQVIFGGPTGNFVLQHRSDDKFALDKGGVIGLAVSTGAVAAGSWAIVTVAVSTAGTVSFRINGADAGSSTISPFSWAGTAGGVTSTGGNNTFAGSYVGSLAERTARDDLTLATIEKDEGYLAWKYALEGNLDAAHPYKSAAPTVGGGTPSVTPDSSVHGHTAGQPSITFGGSLAVDGALHGHTAASPALAFATTVSASSALHDHTATSPTLAANDNAVHPANATHAHWTTSPVLVSTPLVVPGYTDPLAIEGGGSVVAGSISSTGRVVAGYLRGRP